VYDLVAHDLRLSLSAKISSDQTESMPTVHGCPSQDTMIRLQSVQNAAARLVFDVQITVAHLQLPDPDYRTVFHRT